MEVEIIVVENDVERRSELACKICPMTTLRYCRKQGLAKSYALNRALDEGFQGNSVLDDDISVDSKWFRG